MKLSNKQFKKVGEKAIFDILIRMLYFAKNHILSINDYEV